MREQNKNHLLEQIQNLADAVSNVDDELQNLMSNARKAESYMNDVKDNITTLKEAIQEHTPGPFEAYAKFVSQLTTKENHTHVALGLSSEAGEVTSLIKAAFVQGSIPDRAKILDELGDVMFYIQMACNIYKVPLAVVIGGNMEKLRARFPNGYNTADAIAKVDKR